ncbi:PLAC8 family-domain-containing protein [Lentinula aciculospora]|uniref:PLAC8 family-domain-containing protein n=1 Tax=Lentinula aciculospora TaxID=153920 RepID=A0A9W9DTP7_9AGAR|nr:PLAC8 family-domain-containing protein [Lentinula aciculospora]
MMRVEKESIQKHKISSPSTRSSKPEERDTRSPKTVSMLTTEATYESSPSPAPPNYSLSPPETSLTSSIPDLGSAGTHSEKKSDHLAATPKYMSERPSHSNHPSVEESPDHFLSPRTRNESLSSYPPQAPSMLSTQVISAQPSPQEVMMPQVIGSRNARKKPVDLRGKRDWNSTLCGCHAGDDHEIDTCCTACFCPCILFGRNKTRMDHLANHNSPEPTGDTNGEACAVHGITTSLSLLGGCILQIPLRATIRDRYSIAGSCLGDCCTSIFCYPCALTQEHIEISGEEHSFPRGVGGSSGIYYDDPKRYQA